jgi:hypothetical protein
MTNDRASIESADLIREAAEWRLISLLLERPAGDWLEQVAALACEVRDEQLSAAADAAAAAPTDAAPGLYDTTFGPGGPAAPREVSYRQCLDGNFLAELGALYDAFAYGGNADYPPDHVAVQAGFVAYLNIKRVYALMSGDDELAAFAADAARRVIEEHLCLMAEPLAKSLEYSGIRYLAFAASALLERVGLPQRQAVTIPVLDDQSNGGCAAGCSFDDDADDDGSAEVAPV